MNNLQILIQDDWYVAVHKPSGLLMHRRPGNRHDAAAVQQTRNLIGQRVYPVHRLDRSTSGVLLFGLSSDAARRLAAQFGEHTVDKVYWAVVRGFVDVSGCIDYAFSPEQGKSLVTAVTEYRRLATVEFPCPVGPYPVARYSLVEVRPKTGRRHQIRKHFHHISHPVVGDTRLGDSAHNRLFRERFGLHRLLLIAMHLGFTHPFTGATTVIRTQLDPEVLTLFEQFGWSPEHVNAGAER